jgi:glutathione S-transferase
MHLYIANKAYSSWSLRPWLLMTAFGIPFEERLIPMYLPDSKARMLDIAPSGKVPCLVDGDVRVWESLAIVEYLSERFSDKAIWPREVAARAHARAVSSEMHAGFQALRQACPMNLTKRFRRRDDLGSDVADNLRRIEAMWADARRRFGAGGPFLYGSFSAADAMYAPVVSRLHGYGFEVAPETRRYMDAVLAHPAFRSWLSAALEEPWLLLHYEQGWTAAEVLHKGRAEAVTTLPA